MRNLSLILFLFATLTAAPLAADDDLFGEEGADETKEGWSKLFVGGGVIQLDVSGSMGIRNDSGHVTVVDWDRFGLDHRETSYWFQFNWRFGEKWSLWGASYHYDETGFRVFDSDLDLGDGNVIPVGAAVSTRFATTWYILEATRSFIRTKNLEAGLGFGIHAVDFDTEIVGRVVSGESSEELIRTGYATLAPLPNVMGHLLWKFHPRWMWATRVGWFGLTYDKYSGSMHNLTTNLTYDLTERVGIGAGYMFVNLDVDIEEERFTEVYDLDFDGPFAYVRFNF